jgi:hypothetical protein
MSETHKHPPVSLESLPAARFVGPDSNDEIDTILTEHLRTVKDHYEDELPHSQEFDHAIKGIFAATKAYAAQELGLDITSRFPDLDDFHILSMEAMRKEFPWLEEYDKKLDIYGVAAGGREIVIREYKTEELPLTLHVAQHELFHVLSLNTYRPEVSWVSPQERNITNQPAGVGLRIAKTNAFSILDEFITERTT